MNAIARADVDFSKLMPVGLTEDEVNFVYNVEILGLPVRKAAAMAGMPLGKSVAPHIVQSREIAKRALRGALQITREDVVHGYMEAVEMAKLLADPLTMIVGWEKTAKLLGLEAPQRVDINLTASIEVAQSRIKTMSDSELAQSLGANNIIDADFYEVPGGEKEV